MITDFSKDAFIELIKNKNTEILNSQGRSKLSISKIKEQIQEPFDKEGIAKKTHDKNFDNPNSEYYQMSTEEIIAEWERRGAVSCAYGNNVDKYMELRYNNASDIELEMFKLECNYDYDERMKLLIAGEDEILKRFSSKGIEFIARELPLFYTSNNVYGNGRFDAIFYDTNRNKIMIIDWKNSGEIALSNKWSKLLGPAASLDKCDGNLFTLQVHFYKAALLHTYKITDDPSDIEVYIVQFTGKEDNKVNVIKENFSYNEDLLNNCMQYAEKKIKLQQMISEKKK